MSESGFSTHSGSQRILTEFLLLKFWSNTVCQLLDYFTNYMYYGEIGFKLGDSIGVNLTENHLLWEILEFLHPRTVE